jgi:hypothetical protein
LQFHVVFEQSLCGDQVQPPGRFTADADRPVAGLFDEASPHIDHADNG